MKIGQPIKIMMDGQQLSFLTHYFSLLIKDLREFMSNEPSRKGHVNAEGHQPVLGTLCRVTWRMYI